MPSERRSRAPDPELIRQVKTLLDPMLMVLSLWACFLISHHQVPGLAVLIGALTFLLAYPGSVHFRQGPMPMLGGILRKWLVIIGALLLLGYASGFLLEQIYPRDRRLLLIWASVTPFLVWFVHLLVPRLMPRVFAMQGLHTAIVVGANPLGQSITSTINDNQYETRRVVAYFDDRHPERLGDVGSAPIAGRLEEVAEFVKRRNVNLIYIALPMASQPRILSLLDSLRDTTASVYFVPDLFFMDLIQSRVDTVGTMPVLAVWDTPFNGARAVMKRLFDLAIAVPAVIGTTPLMLMIALLIKLSTPGPVFFKQRRYGLDGREIEVWKFRTMRVIEDGHAQYRQTQRGDHRVTPIGRFLRRTSLDELPQFFNVLAGEMSVVGPRPHVIAVNETYRKLIPGYMIRHKVKPGITGWAQVNGYRGGDDLEAMQGRVQCDLEYLRDWTPMMDLKIVVRTLRLVLAGDPRAY